MTSSAGKKKRLQQTQMSNRKRREGLSRQLLLAFFLCAAAVPAADRSADWLTVAGNMQRTNWGPGCPEPPLKYDWVWANGEVLAQVNATPMKGLAPTNGMPREITVPFAATAQPVVKGGIVYVGSGDTHVYAIDLKTGKTIWKSEPASGKILHSLTAGEDGLYAATLGGVDCFTYSGKRKWTFAGAGRGFWLCPALADGLVLAGDIPGNFYALEAKTGKEKWRFKAGSSIYHSPAVYKDRVYFGAEDMVAYCLTLETGKLVWQKHLSGFAFSHFWPVVVAQQNAIIFRTASLGGLWPPYKIVAAAPHNYRKSQEALREYYRQNPNVHDFFVLNADTGKEQVFVAPGHFSSSGDTASPPVVRADGTTYALNYAREGAFLNSHEFKEWAKCLDVGKIDFKSGFFQALGPTGSMRGSLDIVRADGPTTLMCAGGDYLVIWYHRGFTIEPLTKGKPRWKGTLGHKPGFLRGHYNPHSPTWGTPAVLPDRIVATVYGGFIVAYASASAGE